MNFFASHALTRILNQSILIVLVTHFVGFRSYTSLGTKPPTPLQACWSTAPGTSHQQVHQYLVSSSHLISFNKKEIRDSHYSCFPCPSQALYFPNAALAAMSFTKVSTPDKTFSLEVLAATAHFFLEADWFPRQFIVLLHVMMDNIVMDIYSHYKEKQR